MATLTGEVDHHIHHHRCFRLSGLRNNLHFTTIVLQGKAIGVGIGCILGMFPLFFYKDDEKKKEDGAQDPPPPPPPPPDSASKSA